MNPNRSQLSLRKRSPYTKLSHEFQPPTKKSCSRHMIPLKAWGRWTETNLYCWWAQLSSLTDWNCVEAAREIQETLDGCSHLHHANPWPYLPFHSAGGGGGDGGGGDGVRRSMHMECQGQWMLATPSPFQTCLHGPCSQMEMTHPPCPLGWNPWSPMRCHSHQRSLMKVRS